MSRERFDFIFGMGAGCSCSRMLRERGLQYASFPLDWVGDPCLDAGEDIRLVADLASGGFREWFEKENLERNTLYDSSKHMSFYDRKVRLFFAHDFSQGGDFDSEYQIAKKKYERRIERFKEVLSGARKALAVWVADPRGSGETSSDDMQYVLSAFRRAYPKTEFHVLAANCVPGLKPEEMRIARGDGWESLSFDYRVVTVGKPTWDVRTELFSPIFDRFEAADYRTGAEKRANARREKAREYEKFNAKSPIDLFMTKMRFKLYRHLKRRLERKGVQMEDPSCQHPK